MRAVFLFWVGSFVANAAPDVIGFQKTVQPFLEGYCLDCHDNETQEGKLSLEGIRPTMTEGVGDLAVGAGTIAVRRYAAGEEEQPEPAERAAVLADRGELLKTQEPGALAEEKLTQPQFGNYVDHTALFEQRRSHVTPTSRLWAAPGDLQRHHAAPQRAHHRFGQWAEQK